MSNALTTQEFGLPSTVFADAPKENDLGAGVSGGYGMIGYKGKVWSIRSRGNEQVLMREDGDGPRGSVEIIILKASQAISKVWYEKGFEEGTKAPPDCFSANGLTPDPSSTKKQASVCATCPRNAFGSAVKQDGTPGKGKACSDSKRLAVVPMNDIENEMLGGPMLLRVPAASLNDVATYGAAVAKMGFPYYGIATRVAFDAQDAYPKFVLSPIRKLTDEEAVKVLEMRNDVRVDRILAESPYENGPGPEESKPGLAFEVPTGMSVQDAGDAAMKAALIASGAAKAKVPTPRKAKAPVAPKPEAPKATTGFGTAAAPATVATAAAPAPVASVAPVKTTGFGTAAAPVAAPTAALAPADAESAAAFNAALDAEVDALMGAPVA